MQLFHYHLLTSRVRDLEARYLGKLGFELVARYGRVGDDEASYEAGVSWEQLDELGFRLRLTELQRGAVNVVIQPGQWPQPRVDHLGFVCEDEEFLLVLDRASQRDLRIQERGGRRTFVATNAGYRLEVHPRRDWIDDLLAASDDLRIEELHLRADEPEAKGTVLGELLDLPQNDGGLRVGGTLVRFLPGGPQGRPVLHAELFS